MLRSTSRTASVVRRSRFLLAASLILVPAAACSNLGTGPVPPRAAGGTAPPAEAPPSFDRPFYAGVFLGDAESSPECVDDELDRLTRMVGKQPALVKTFRTLGEDFSPGSWVGRLMTKVHEERSTNYVALDLQYAGGPGSRLLDAIAQGRADEAIRHNARQARALGFEVLLSPGWEMNGRWNQYCWQGHAKGAEQGGPAL